MKIKFKRNHLDKVTGDIMDTTNELAHYLINAGVAEELTAGHEHKEPVHKRVLQKKK
jgi:hypothetical protein